MSGRTSPSNMSVISSTLSNFSLPFNSYSSTKSKKYSNNGSTVDETPPTIVRLTFSVEKRDQDKFFLRTNLTVIFWLFFSGYILHSFKLQNQDILNDKDYKKVLIKPVSNQITVVAFQSVQLTQALFLQKNQTLQNIFLISVTLRWHRALVACKNQSL